MATVNALASRIVEILGLTDEAVPDWLRDLQDRLGGFLGGRHDDDPAETADPPTEEPKGTNTEPPDRGFDFLPSPCTPICRFLAQHSPDGRETAVGFG
jgi:hypothetical protein